MTPGGSSELALLAAEGVLTIIFSGGWPGFLIIMVLLALSLTAAYLVFEHVMTIRKRELMPEGLDHKVRQLLAVRRYEDAEKLCREHPSLLSFVLLHGISEMDGGWPAIEKGLEDALSEQAARLMRKVEFLSVIGNLAPMIGLLGTVMGMLMAFQRVAATQGAAGAAELAEGIYQALVTTVGGLIIAIPALGAFAFFRNRIDELVAEAAYVAQHTCKPLQRRGGSGGGIAAPPAPPPVGRNA
jgi:biopolymer transport protein ExbB